MGMTADLIIDQLLGRRIRLDGPKARTGTIRGMHSIPGRVPRVIVEFDDDHRLDSIDLQTFVLLPDLE